jgi:hypothetical protein
VKGKLIGHFIANDDKYLTQMTAILERISQNELNRIFQNWVEKV